MENPFKKIIEHQEVPEILKEKVLNDIGMIKLTLDVADLFVIKYPGTFGSFLKLKENKKPRKK